MSITTMLKCTEHSLELFSSHLATIHVVDNEVEFFRSLERVVKTDEERVVDVADEDVSLCHYVRRFILPEDVWLVQHLHCIELLVSLVAC